MARQKLPTNPLVRVKLLRKSNVRRSVIDEEGFRRLFEASEEALKPVLVTAFDTGMRKREILDLRWEMVKLKDGEIHLTPSDTKAEDARIVVLTARVKELLSKLPHGLPSMTVFPNPTTGRPYIDVRKMFLRAKKKAELPDLWFHDLRRSFITRARKLGIPESVVMRMSGHRTRAVFDRYNVVSVDDQRAAVGRLDESWTRFGHFFRRLSGARQASEITLLELVDTRVTAAWNRSRRKSPRGTDSPELLPPWYSRREKRPWTSTW